MRIGLIIALALVLATGLANADCSQDAYLNACSSCSFDAAGKIDASCSQGSKASGIACVSSTYPIASGKYAAGQCPGIDACASTLSSCVNYEKSGNDKQDCEGPVVAQCYRESDLCVARAAQDCGEDVQVPCSLPIAILLALFAGSALFAKKN